MKTYYDKLEQIERILNKAKGERFSIFRKLIEAKYNLKVFECFGYEGRREPIYKFSAIY